MKNTVAIICTNDAHCALTASATSMGYTGVAGVVYEYKERYGDENVLLVDAGDCFAGGVSGLLSDGKDPLAVMNACGYDAAALGNADFTFGAHRLKRLEVEASFPFLCCNFLDSHGKALFPKYCIKHAGSKRIAFVGAITPRAVNMPSAISDDGPLSSTDFCGDSTGEALVSAVQSAVDEVREQGVDYVVLLAHLGQGGQKYEWSSKNIARQTTGIDVIVDGHSHECLEQVFCNKSGDRVPLIQAGTTLSNAGVVLLDAESGGIETRLLGLADAGHDESVSEVVAGIVSEKEALLSQLVGEAATVLVAKDEAGVGWVVRSHETNLGDLVADAFRAAAQADAACIPAWSIRSSIQQGAVTRGDIFKVLPLGMDVSSLELTGQQIADYLEFAVRHAPESNGSFPQVSGISFTLDASAKSSVTLDEAGSFAGVNGSRRVSNIMVGESPVDLDATYSVAGIGILMENAGEGLSMLEGAPVLKSKVLGDVDAVVDFVQNQLGGKIAEGYQNPSGSSRISVKR